MLVRFSIISDDSIIVDLNPKCVQSLSYVSKYNSPNRFWSDKEYTLIVMANNTEYAIELPYEEVYMLLHAFNGMNQPVESQP